MSKPLALVVEDANDLAIIFSRALEAAGFQTEILLDGRQAIERLGEVEPALIVLDMHLPRLSGPEVLGHIRADARLAATRVIIATADTARTIGPPEEQADVVLIKPISFTQLRDLALRMHPTNLS